MSRWIQILATTPSGKAQFVCRFCGRTSIAPDKVCKNLPSLHTGGLGSHARAGKSCEELEKEDAELTRASITWNAIPRATTLAERFVGAPVPEVAAAIRKDRLLLFDYLVLQARKVSDRTRGEVTTIERFLRGLGIVREEMEKK